MQSYKSTLFLLKKETQTPVFSSEFCEFFKNTFFTEQLRATASENCTETGIDQTTRQR